MNHGDIAFVKEQGVDFAVVCVADRFVESPAERSSVHTAWTVSLRQPVALIGANRHAVFGHEKIIDFVCSVDPHSLPWQHEHP